MDACYMSMFEVCFQIRKHVNILVGPEGLEPEFGWPYTHIVKKAVEWRQQTASTANPNGVPMEPESVATMVVTTHVEFYSDYDRSAGRSVDMAAIRLGDDGETMKDLAKHIDDMAKALKNAGKPDDVTLAHWGAQTYKFDQFVDLYDFCEEIQQRFGETSTIGQKCGQTKDLLGGVPLGNGAIIRSGCSGFAYQYSHGLSIYFPWALVSIDYQDLGVTASTQGCKNWLDFITDQVDKTRRSPPRFDEGSNYPTDLGPVADSIADFHARTQFDPVKRSVQKAFGNTVNSQLDTVRNQWRDSKKQEVGGKLGRFKKEDMPL